MADEEQAAEESSHVMRAREKLKKQIVAERKLLTPERLNQVSQVMRNWLERHQPERINLKDKTVALFDENRHPANISSQFIKDLRHTITDSGGRLEAPTEEGEEPTVSPLSAWRGRIHKEEIRDIEDEDS